MSNRFFVITCVVISGVGCNPVLSPTSPLDSGQQLQLSAVNPSADPPSALPDSKYSGRGRGRLVVDLQGEIHIAVDLEAPQEMGGVLVKHLHYHFIAADPADAEALPADWEGAFRVEVDQDNHYAKVIVDDEPMFAFTVDRIGGDESVHSDGKMVMLTHGQQLAIAGFRDADIEQIIAKSGLQADALGAVGWSRIWLPAPKSELTSGGAGTGCKCPATSAGCSSGGNGSPSCSTSGCTGVPSACSVTCAGTQWPSACCFCDGTGLQACCKCCKFPISD